MTTTLNLTVFDNGEDDISVQTKGKKIIISCSTRACYPEKYVDVEIDEETADKFIAALQMAKSWIKKDRD